MTTARRQRTRGRTAGIRRIAWLLGPLVGLVGATGGIAALLASRIVGIRRHQRYRHRLIAIEGDKAVLRRDAQTERPGVYGLASREGHAVIGEIESITDTVVVRPIDRVDHGCLVPGPVALDHVHLGDPRSAVGLDYEEIALEGDAGVLPAWLLHGDDTWVLVAHGYGGTRSSSLSFLPMLRGAGFSVLVVSYRNDPGAGPSEDNRYHLGDEEWQDVDVAMAYALSRGARRLVLFGWSLGGAVVLQALARSPRRSHVVALVLDSPVLDWRAVIRHVGRRSHVPGPFVNLALNLVKRQIGVDFDDFDWLERHGELSVPTLLLHGEGDATVPFAESAAFARRRPDLVELVVVAGAGHVGSWNVDPDAYAAVVTGFIGRHLLAEAGVSSTATGMAQAGPSGPTDGGDATSTS